MECHLSDAAVISLKERRGKEFFFSHFSSAPASPDPEDTGTCVYVIGFFDIVTLLNVSPTRISFACQVSYCTAEIPTQTGGHLFIDEPRWGPSHLTCPTLTSIHSTLLYQYHVTHHICCKFESIISLFFFNLILTESSEWWRTTDETQEATPTRW